MNYFEKIIQPHRPYRFYSVEKISDKIHLVTYNENEQEPHVTDYKNSPEYWTNFANTSASITKQRFKELELAHLLRQS